jgi:hypothetical protein
MKNQMFLKELLRIFKCVCFIAQFHTKLLVLVILYVKESDLKSGDKPATQLAKLELEEIRRTACTA